MRGDRVAQRGRRKIPLRRQAGAPFLFLQGKVGYWIAPSSDPASPAHLPPRGRLWGRGMPLPVCKTTLPARPAGGRAVTGVGQMGRRTGKKGEDPPQGLPQTRKGGSREEEPLPPWCSPDFLQRKSGSPRGHRRGPLGRCAPRGASEPPTPRVRTTVMPLVWLAGFEFRSPLTRLKDAGTFCVPWLHGNLSQRVYKRQFHKYHSFFLTILLLFATINMKILSLENVK